MTDLSPTVKKLNKADRLLREARVELEAVSELLGDGNDAVTGALFNLKLSQARTASLLSLIETARPPLD